MHIQDPSIILCQELMHQLGDEQLERYMQYDRCEYDGEYLGFIEVYCAVHVPDDWTVIDLGCNQAAQAWYFKNAAHYIGIDMGIPSKYQTRQDNATYYNMSGQQFIKTVLPDLVTNGTIDPDKTITLCVAVPDKELQHMVMDTFSYHVVTYPTDIISAQMPDPSSFEDSIPKCKPFELCAAI